jgi:AcrR family transcriptional regulator
VSERDSRGPAAGLRAAGVARTPPAIHTPPRKHQIEVGYHRLSLEQVAADAGITRVTIYRQFASKLGLLDAVADDLAQRSQVVRGMETAAAMADPAAAFRAMVSELCRFWGTDPDLFRRLIGLAAVDPEADQVVGSREQWRYDQVAAFVRRLADDGRLRGDADVDRSATAIGAVTGFVPCDDMAIRLKLPHDQLDGLVITFLNGVVRLD